MDVKSCRNCGRLFNYLQGQPICPTCKGELEKKFVQVKEYIRANEGATMQQISEGNDVSVKQVKQWVREERLVFTDKSPVGVTCEKCGEMIRTGRFCNKCKNTMSDTLKKLYVTSAPNSDSAKRNRDGDRMRFLDKN